MRLFGLLRLWGGIAFLFLGYLSLPGSARAEWREFTSADGTKTVRAEVVSYDERIDGFVLRLEDGRRIRSQASFFSEEDQAYLDRFALAQQVGRRLRLDFADEAEEVSVKKNPLNGYQTIRLQSGFAINLRNNSQVTFDGLTAEYQLFYSAYVNPFEDREQKELVKQGKLELPRLQPRGEAKVATDRVEMTSIKRLPIAECVGGT